MIFYDTHSHVNFNAFRNDADGVIARALEAGVRMNVVGSQIDTSKRAVEFATKYPDQLRAVVGLHPVHLVQMHLDEEEDSFDTRAEVFDPEAYRTLLRSPLAVGVGECGLDYFRLPESAKDGTGATLDQAQIRALQQEVFRGQIKLAIEEQKTLMVHTRQGERARDSAGTNGGPNAYDDVYNILKSYSFSLTTDDLRVIMHCFSGTLDHARAFLDLGATLSFTGIITFKNAKELHEVVRQTPLERICIETDSPYLAPEPHRGQRNEPLYVIEVAKAVAELKGIPLEQVAEQTTKNAIVLFEK